MYTYSLPAAKESLIFKFIKYRSMMEIRVRKDSVNPATDRAKFCYRRFLDADSGMQFRTERFIYMQRCDEKCDELQMRDMNKIPAGKIFVAVK